MISSGLKHKVYFRFTGKKLTLKIIFKPLAIKVFKKIIQLESFFIKQVFFACLNFVYRSDKVRVAYGKMLMAEKKYNAALKLFKNAGPDGINNLLNYYLENKNDAELSRQVEIWQKKTPQKQIRNFAAITKVSEYLKIPEDQLVKYKSEIYKYSTSKELVKPHQAFTFLIQSGFLTEAKKLNGQLLNQEDRNAYLQDVLSRAGSIESEIQTAAKNSISENKLAIVGNEISPYEQLNKKNEKIVELCIPHTFLVNWNKDPNLTPIRNHLLTLYKNIIQYLKENQVPFIPRIQFGFFMNSLDPKNLISFTYHSKGGHENQYHIKYSAYSNFISMDSAGFAGWSSISKQKNYFDLSHIDVEAANQRWKYLKECLISKNISKFSQKSDDSSKVNYGKFLFIPLQVTDDCVSKLAYIEGVKLLNVLIQKFKRSDLNIVIKRHPMCSDPQITKLLNKAKKYPNVFVSNESIHKLIANSDAVFTVNSGVGAEALLHLKPVITTGRSEYAQATITAKTESDLLQIIENKAWEAVDPTEIKKFLYQYTTNYLVESDNFESISRRLKHIGI